jgi:Leu/Phe-tRNA-protein transferase
MSKVYQSTLGHSMDAWREWTLAGVVYPPSAGLTAAAESPMMLTG